MNIKNKIVKNGRRKNCEKNSSLKTSKYGLDINNNEEKKIIYEKESNQDNSKKSLKESGESNNKLKEENQKQGQSIIYEEEISKLKEEKLRLLAEMENIRKRFEREKSDSIRYGSTNLARDILSPHDNLARALENIPDNKNLSDPLNNFIDGLKMVQKEFTTILEKHGVTKIDALNKKFDHNLHLAMLEIETDKKENGIVVQEIQSGYTMHDRLLRPASVGVSKQSKKNKDKK